MQKTLFPFPGIFEGIKAQDYPYHFTKTYPKKVQKNADKAKVTGNT